MREIVAETNVQETIRKLIVSCTFGTTSAKAHKYGCLTR